MDENLTRFSDSLTTSFTKMYQAGGLALVFVFVGIITMFVGHFYKSTLSGWIFSIGAVITVACLGLFLYTQLKKPIRSTRVSRKEREMAEAIEEITLELTRTISATQSLTFKYIKRVDRILDAVIPLLTLIPGVRKKLEEAGVSDARSASKVIVDTSTQIENIVRDTQKALVDRDPKKLRDYSNALRNATEALKRALASRN